MVTQLAPGRLRAAGQWRWAGRGGALMRGRTERWRWAGRRSRIPVLKIFCCVICHFLCTSGPGEALRSWLLTLPFSSSVVSDKAFNFSKPQFTNLNIGLSLCGVSSQTHLTMFRLNRAEWGQAPLRASVRWETMFSWSQFWALQCVSCETDSDSTVLCLKLGCSVLRYFLSV